MATDDNSKYNVIENVLQCINTHYISLPEEEVKRNNKILREVLDQIILKMKQKKTLFDSVFQRLFFGGSYYDGLRVGKPEEYDLDCLLRLPKYSNPTIIQSDMPGFVHVQLKDIKKFEDQPEAHKFNGLRDLMDDDNYLETNKVLAWMEGVVSAALNEFDKLENDNSFTVINTESGGKFKVKIHKTGPAFTLKLESIMDEVPTIMDIDLVPCFVFKKENWPEEPYRKNPVTSKGDFFIVPKKPGSDKEVKRYWRLSFQEQERDLINGLQNLKPCVKLLKKLRDMLNHKRVASYYIKTIFLWELENNRTLFNNQLSYVFIEMLKKYQNYMSEGNIPYFWNKENNLMGKEKPISLQNMANKLKNVIQDIEKKYLLDPYIPAKYLVDSEQCEQIKKDAIIGKKVKKQIQRFQESSTVKVVESADILILSNTNNQTTQNLTEISLKSKKLDSFANQDVVDGSSCSSVIVDNSVLLSAINKLLNSVDELRKDVIKLQDDNQVIMTNTQILKEKIEFLDDNFKDVVKENRMFRTKLKNNIPETDGNNVDIIFDDRLTLTANFNDSMTS